MIIFVRDPAPPVLTASLADAELKLQLGGTVGQHYLVEFQPSLPPSGAWQVLTEIVSLAASPLVISDPVTNAQRFYRAVALP